MNRHSPQSDVSPIAAPNPPALNSKPKSTLKESGVRYDCERTARAQARSRNPDVILWQRGVQD